MPNDEDCGERCEGNTHFCGSHNRFLRKEKELAEKAIAKKASFLSKPKKVSKGISRNPKDWSNTFLCSDGVRVTQEVINIKLRQTYDQIDDCFCQGCGGIGNSHAHIISQKRCKQIGKTELIWHRDNIFWSDFECNAAIENPKGKAWKRLKNIEKCLSFIKQHDPELYMKFEQATINQETEPHKI